LKNPNALLIFARVPEVARSGGGDPFASLPWEDLDSVFHGCAGDLIQSAISVPDTDVLVYRDTRFPHEKLLAWSGEGITQMDLPDGPIGDAVQQAADGAFIDDYHRVTVILENNPLLGAGLLANASGQLGVEDECAVVVPSDSGGPLLVALKAGCRSLFSGEDPAAGGRWSGVVERLCLEEMMLFPMRSSFLLNTTAGIERLRGEIAGLDPEHPGFPKRTDLAFRALEKKYRWKRGRP
jgi:hypothetical protein